MSLDDLLTDTCTVRRATSAVDAVGMAVRSYAEETVPCSIQSAGTAEAMRRQQITGRQTYTGYFRMGEAPQSVGDEVVWRGRTLAVIGPPVDAVGRQHHEQVTLEEPADG